MTLTEYIDMLAHIEQILRNEEVMAADISGSTIVIAVCEYIADQQHKAHSKVRQIHDILITKIPELSDYQFTYSNDDYTMFLVLYDD